MIDSHLHFEEEDFPHISEIISRAQSKNVNYFILAATSKEDLALTMKIANEYSHVFAVLGFHPEFASSITYDDLAYLETFLNNPKVVGIGEIGLDYHYDKDSKTKERQQWLFKKQLDLACRYNLPIVVHSRDATKDTYDILKEYNLKGSIHCFSGSLETALEFIKLGYYLGIGGVLTYKNSNLPGVVKKLPLTSLILETDSPYLSSVRGKRNEPANVFIVASFLADLLHVPIEKIEEVTYQNTVALFDLDNKL